MKQPSPAKKRKPTKPPSTPLERDVLFEGTVARFRSDHRDVDKLNAFLNAPVGRKLWSALANTRPKGRAPSNIGISSDELIGYISGFEACLGLIRAMATPSESTPEVQTTWDDPDFPDNDEQ